MTHPPRFPEDRPGDARVEKSAADAGGSERGVDQDQQGRFGDLKQNLTNQWKVQSR